MGARALASVVAASLFALAGCGPATDDGEDAPAISTVLVESSVVPNQGSVLPPRYTCDGADVSPPLAWSGLPEDTLEVAILLHDQDAPAGSISHWVVFGVAPASASLREAELPSGARVATNSFGRRGYDGPCPPRGQLHTYSLTVYALRSRILLPDGADAEDVRSAIEGRVSDQGTLAFTYGR